LNRSPTVEKIPRTLPAKEVEMAVAIEMKFKGATLEQYNEVLKLMGLDDGQSAPPGAVFHWVAKTDDGLHIVDVWESREVFDKFAEEQIGPYSAQVGITEPPETTYYEVHNTIKA
jgi:hypothetical protein